MTKNKRRETMKNKLMGGNILRETCAIDPNERNAQSSIN